MRFSREHEWIEPQGDLAAMGITAYAAGQLGDVVFVELPTVGRRVKAGEALAVVESVKAASDVYAPVSGEVVAVNAALPDSPDVLNAMPESDAWLVKLKLDDPGELDRLMDRPAYEAFLGTL